MISAFVTLIVWLLVIGILAALVIYVVDVIPLPPPINRLVKVAVVVVASIVVVLLLLQLLGVSVGGLPRIDVD